MKRIIPLVLAAFLVTGCSGGPSEPELTVAFEQQFTEQMQKQADAMKMMSAFVPESMKAALEPAKVSVQELMIEEQTEKENGDFVSKVTMLLVSGDKEQKISMRITTTVADGQLKIIDSESKVL